MTAPVTRQKRNAIAFESSNNKRVRRSPKACRRYFFDTRSSGIL